MKRVDSRDPRVKDKRTDRDAARGPDEPWGDLLGWICEFKLISGESKLMYVDVVTETEATNGASLRILRTDVLTVQRRMTDHG